MGLSAQVYWLLLAYTQDFPKEKYAEELRDRCEEAALDGYWVCWADMRMWLALAASN